MQTSRVLMRASRRLALAPRARATTVRSMAAPFVALPSQTARKSLRPSAALRLTGPLRAVPLARRTFSAAAASDGKAATTNQTSVKYKAGGVGRIVSVIGAVVDVQFNIDRKAVRAGRRCPPGARGSHASCCRAMPMSCRRF
jgi:hypothetical protein